MLRCLGLAPAHKSPTRSAKRAKHSRQAQDITDLKNQMARPLVFGQAAGSSLCSGPGSADNNSPGADPACTSGHPRCSRTGCQQDQDVISGAASWESGSFHQEEEGQVQELTSELMTTDAGFSPIPIPNSISALMEWASKFLQTGVETVDEEDVEETLKDVDLLEDNKWECQVDAGQEADESTEEDTVASWGDHEEDLINDNKEDINKAAEELPQETPEEPSQEMENLHQEMPELEQEESRKLQVPERTYAFKTSYLEITGQ
ncbi:UNVERIFIED_CONTAM: hypothetical protein FKN15_034887 [Acipenser sinensis]